MFRILLLWTYAVEAVFEFLFVSLALHGRHIGSCCQPHWRQRRCRRHTFRFCSVTFKGMYGFHSNFAELYITIKYRSSLILVILSQILAMVLFRLIFCCLFPHNNFWRDALISFKLCRTLYQCKIQLKLNIANQSPNCGWVIALFSLSFCWCVDIGFQLITFAGMHWFYWKFAEWYIIVKYRSSWILVIISRILAVMALFGLSLCWCVDIGFCSITYAGMHWFYWKFAEWYIIVKYRSSSI